MSAGETRQRWLDLLTGEVPAHYAQWHAHNATHGLFRLLRQKCRGRWFKAVAGAQLALLHVRTGDAYTRRLFTAAGMDRSANA